jgi:hypothetical protein
MPRTINIAKVPLTATPKDVCAEFKLLDAQVVSGIYYGTFGAHKISSGLGFVTFESDAVCQKWRTEVTKKHKRTPYLIDPKRHDFKPFWHNAILISDLPHSNNEADISNALRKAYRDFTDVEIHVNLASHWALVKFLNRADQHKALKDNSDVRIGPGSGIRVTANAAVPNEIQNALIIRNLPPDLLESDLDVAEIRNVVRRAYLGYYNVEVEVDRSLRAAIVRFASVRERDGAIRHNPDIVLNSGKLLPVTQRAAVPESPALRTLNGDSVAQVLQPPQPPQPPPGSLFARIRTHTSSIISHVLAYLMFFPRFLTTLPWTALTQRRLSHEFISLFDKFIGLLLSHSIRASIGLAAFATGTWFFLGPIAESTGAAAFSSLLIFLIGQILVLSIHLLHSVDLFNFQIRSPVKKLRVLASCAGASLPWIVYSFFPRFDALLLRTIACAGFLVIAPAGIVAVLAIGLWISRFKWDRFFKTARDQFTVPAKEALLRDDGRDPGQILGLPFWRADTDGGSLTCSDAKEMKLWPLLVGFWSDRGLWRTPMAALAFFAFGQCLKYVLVHGMIDG